MNSMVLTITLTGFIVCILLYLVFHMSYFSWHEKHVEDYSSKDKKLVDKSFYNILRNFKWGKK